MTVPVRSDVHGDVIESIIAKGDLSKLTPEERTQYYVQLCRSLGMNPHTQPFAYITLNGKLTLYAKRDAADQLRKIHGISLQIVSQEQADGLLSIHVKATDKDGRSDEDLGVVAFPEALKGEARANAILKAVTKAKRRVTLSISGLGFLDEMEVADVPTARRPPPPAANVMLPPHDPQTGEIIEAPLLPGADAAAGPSESHATPAAASPDPPEDESERLAGLDRLLTAAAKNGTEILKAAWVQISKEDKAVLKAALERRYKTMALEADEEKKRQGGEDER
jgi:hypothetical protein